MRLVSATLTQAGGSTFLGLGFHACKVGGTKGSPLTSDDCVHRPNKQGRRRRGRGFPSRPHPLGRFLSGAGGTPASCSALAIRAVAQCPLAGSGAASYPGVPFPSRGHLGRAPARCPIAGPASCVARAPAPVPPTPRAARTPGPCAALRGAARCLGTQATPSEFPGPVSPPEPLSDPAWFCVNIPVNPLLSLTPELLTTFLLFQLPSWRSREGHHPTGLSFILPLHRTLDLTCVLWDRVGTEVEPYKPLRARFSPGDKAIEQLENLHH